MALLTKVGSFSKISATGVQAITGVGFTPKAIIFWTSQSNPATAASGTWTPGTSALFGMTAGPTNSYCVQATTDDNIATSSTARRTAAKAISATNNLASGLRFEADLQSFDADGFTLNWTNNAGGGSDVIMYMALGGSDITNTKVVNWTELTATGNKAVTGVGFKPDLVLHASAGNSAVPQSLVDAYPLFGMMNKHGQQASNSIGMPSGVNPSNTSRWQQTDACLTHINGGESILSQAHFVSMDADGFTVNFSNFSSAYQVISLCLKGVSSKIGAFAKTTAAAPAAQSITRCGFQPKAILLSTFSATAQGAPLSRASWNMGASDGTSQRAVALHDVDNVSPTQADSLWRNDRIATMGGDGPTDYANASLTSLDSDGFSLNWLTNDTNASEYLYLALGDAGVDTFPSVAAV